MMRNLDQGTNSTKLKKKKVGRPRTTSKLNPQQKYARMKAVEHDLIRSCSKNQVHMFDYLSRVIRTAKFRTIYNREGIQSVAIKFGKKNVKNNLSKLKVIYALDLERISQRSYMVFRKINNLKQILHGVTSIKNRKRRLNEYLLKKFQIKKSPCGVGVAIENIGIILQDFLEREIRFCKHNNLTLQPHYYFKISGDSCKLSPGPVVMTISPVNFFSIGSQDPYTHIPILVYNGSDSVGNLKDLFPEFFQNLSRLLETQNGKKQCKPIRGCDFTLIRQGDLVHMWHHLYVDAQMVEESDKIPATKKTRKSPSKRPQEAELASTADLIEMNRRSTTLLDSSTSVKPKDRMKTFRLAELVVDEATAVEENSEVEPKSSEFIQLNGKNLVSCCHRCPFCINTLNHIRGRSDPIPTSFDAVFDDLGIKIHTICVLHMIQRSCEWLLSLTCLVNENKTERIQQYLKDRKLIRKEWNFVNKKGFEKNGDEITGLKSGMLFGSDCENLLKDISWINDIYAIIFSKNLKPSEKTLVKKTKLVWEKFQIVVKGFHIKTKDLREFDWNSYQSSILAFKNAYLDRFQRETLNYYLHIIFDHIVDIMKSLARKNLTLVMLSNEGLELSHSFRKKIVERQTSFKNEIGRLLQYVHQILRLFHFHVVRGWPNPRSVNRIKLLLDNGIVDKKSSDEEVSESGTDLESEFGEDMDLVGNEIIEIDEESVETIRLQETKKRDQRLREKKIKSKKK